MPYSDSIDDIDSGRSVGSAPFAAAMNDLFTVRYAQRLTPGQRLRIEGKATRPPTKVAPPAKPVFYDEYGEIEERPNFNAHWGDGPALPLQPEKPRGRTVPLVNMDSRTHEVDTAGSYGDEVASLPDAKVPAHVERLFERALHENGYNRGEIHGHGQRKQSMLSQFGGHFAAVATPHLKAAAERRATADEVSDLLRKSIGRLQQGGAMGMLPLPKRPFEAPDDAVIDLEEAPLDLKVDSKYKELETKRMNDAIARQQLHADLLGEIGVSERDWGPLYDAANSKGSNPLADHLVRQFKQRLATEKKHEHPGRRRAAQQLHNQLFSKGQVKKLQRWRYAADRDDLAASFGNTPVKRENADLDDAFADDAAFVPTAKTQPAGDLFADFDASESLPDRPRTPAAKTKRTPAATNPKAVISKQSLHAKQIVAPLRGTRLAYHLMETIRRYGNVDPDVRPDLKAIADRATAALTGRPHPENDDHFTAVGRMLSEVGDNLGSAYNWHRVKESLAVDTAVRKWMDTQIKATVEGEPISKLAARHLVDKQSHPKKAEQQKSLLRHLQRFVTSEVGHALPDADLSFDKLRRSITRLAGRDADQAEIGSGPRTRKSTATGYVDRREDGTVGAHAVRTDDLPWREYMGMLPGGTSAERYQRLKERVVRYSKVRALKEARQRYVDRQQQLTDEELLPKVEAIVGDKGPTSATTLAARLHVPAHRIQAVVSKGEADGRLQRLTQKGARGPAGTLVDLAPKPQPESSKLQRRASGNRSKVLYMKQNANLSSVFHPSESDIPFLNKLRETGDPTVAAVWADHIDERGDAPIVASLLRQGAMDGDHSTFTHSSDLDAPVIRVDPVQYGRPHSGELRLWLPDGTGHVFHAPVSADQLKELHTRRGTESKTAEVIDRKVRRNPRDLWPGREEPERYAAYKAPAGGMTVQGVFYPGGSMIPDVGRIRDDAPARGRASPAPPAATSTATSSKQQVLESIRSRLKRK